MGEDFSQESRLSIENRIVDAAQKYAKWFPLAANLRLYLCAGRIISGGHGAEMGKSLMTCEGPHVREPQTPDSGMKSEAGGGDGGIRTKSLTN